MIKNKPLSQERRRYLRIDSVLPVQFKLLYGKEGKDLSGWQQGFTNNIGWGGICLQINDLRPDLAEFIRNKEVRVFFEIEAPFSKNPISAFSRIVWIKELSRDTHKILLGLGYEKIEPKTNRRLMRYVWMKKLFIPAVLTTVILLGVFFGVDKYYDLKLIRGNKALVEQLVKAVGESRSARERIGEIDRQRQELELKINSLEERMQSAEKEKAYLNRAFRLEKDASARKLGELNILMEKLKQEKSFLEARLSFSRGKERDAKVEIQRLDEKKTLLEKANLDKMYSWLKIHQNPRTGLVMSFEGDTDISGWAFIYDQSLAAQAYIYFKDYNLAKKILEFFKSRAAKESGLFANAYYTNDGAPAEYSVASGPNIWLGIAAIHYTQKTKDTSYLGLAEEIARGIMNLQSQDNEGGIRGGPDVKWYASEHNLDAYAFFNMLYKLTAKKIYQDAALRVLSWLLQHTYDKLDIPVVRGKEDSTIATDTYAWSIAAVGPEKLSQLGMDPDKILEFAEQNCATEVSYMRPGGQVVKVKGFDFAPQRHLARGGVVSPEWTSQMVVTFKIMADFHRSKQDPAKAYFYERKAEEYLAELFNMIISSPSPSGQGEGCLPYASCDFVDTGHGWMTPKGKSTGSVAATAYTIFAYYKYNPLESEK